MSALMHLWSLKCQLNSTNKCIWPFHLHLFSEKSPLIWTVETQTTNVCAAWNLHPPLSRGSLPNVLMLPRWGQRLGISGSTCPHLDSVLEESPRLFSTETLGVRKLIGSGFSVPAATSRWADLDLCPRASPWRSNALAPFGDYKRMRASTVCFLDWYQTITYLGDILFRLHVF